MEDAANTERDKLIVRLLADTGARVGELVKLRKTDLMIQGRQYYLFSGSRQGVKGAAGADPQPAPTAATLCRQDSAS
jgi:integrase